MGTGICDTSTRNLRNGTIYMDASSDRKETAYRNDQYKASISVWILEPFTSTSVII